MDRIHWPRAMDVMVRSVLACVCRHLRAGNAHLIHGCSDQAVRAYFRTFEGLFGVC